ncbi:hypothetical protein F0562_021738 [Nyssa sinensis]|uniref:Tf2-1-like SH3-like domain-containing protein n=1 Tax=Nyssa sinensis TaxID=561372 RepID=A0A5J5BLS8_9ASTE|nr:hypothetical protein F0562_021738 [Nyssa sinensis]
MKKFADIKRTQRSFNIGDLVYLRLQSYKQQSVAQRRNLKLSPRFYGPYRVREKIGTVAYRFELPLEAKIHPMFHVRGAELSKTLRELANMESDSDAISDSDALKENALLKDGDDSEHFESQTEGETGLVMMK